MAFAAGPFAPDVIVSVRPPPKSNTLFAATAPPWVTAELAVPLRIFSQGIPRR